MSDSHFLIWTILPENNPKIKHNMSKYSFLILMKQPQKKKKNQIISVAETWLLTLAMLSPSPCANKVIRIELREADAQEELRQDAEQLKSMTLRADPLPKAIPAPRRTLPLWPAAQHCGSYKSGFWRGLPGGWGPTAEGRRKRAPLPLPRTRQSSTHQSREQQVFASLTIVPRQ